MDIDELADRVWNAVRSQGKQPSRVRAGRDPFWIGCVLLMLPFIAFDILSWTHTQIVVGALTVLGIARLVYLSVATHRERDR